MFIDTHCHLDFPEFDIDREQVINNSLNQGIEYIINVGSSLSGSLASVSLANKYESIYAVVGIHPHDADHADAGCLQEIRKVSKDKKVIGIGESGLDYYRNYSKKENQLRVFDFFIKLAQEFSLPLVVHSRQAPLDTLKILKNNMPPAAVIHCFSGDRDFLDECIKLGFYVSFTCNITYKKADGLRQLIKELPLERIFLETDAPYLSPEGLRGRRNEPSSVKYVAEEIARIKGIGIDEVAAVTTASAKSFFKIGN
jgi:TatD DNase family protein